MGLPRREVDEIAQLHKRERGRLQEVFVEGTADKHFYEYFLASNGLQQVGVFDVDTVHVEAKELHRLGLKDGKKGRVVALAALLEGHVDKSEVVCIADADLDHFQGVTYPYHLLLLTDTTSIELYVLCPAVMQKVLSVALQGFPKRCEQVIEELVSLLKDSFLFRVAADDIGIFPRFPSNSAFCRIDLKKGGVQFLLRDYLNEALKDQKDPTIHVAVQTQMSVREARQIEVRKRLHGHDFIETLAWYIRQHRGYGQLSEATFEDLALGFIDPSILAGEPMFAELLRRLKRQGS